MATMGLTKQSQIRNVWEQSTQTMDFPLLHNPSIYWCCYAHIQIYFMHCMLHKNPYYYQTTFAVVHWFNWTWQVRGIKYLLLCGMAGVFGLCFFCLEIRSMALDVSSDSIVGDNQDTDFVSVSSGRKCLFTCDVENWPDGSESDPTCMWWEHSCHASLCQDASRHMLPCLSGSHTLLRTHPDAYTHTHTPAARLPASLHSNLLLHGPHSSAVYATSQNITFHNLILEEVLIKEVMALSSSTSLSSFCSAPSLHPFSFSLWLSVAIYDSSITF